jgi:amidase
MGGDLWRSTAVDLAHAIRTRAASACDVVAAAVGRMRAVNPALNAVTVDLGDQALAAAETVDRAIARGEAVGPLAGVPVTIKQNVDQAGCATTNGVVAWKDLIAQTDAPVVANWKAAGAIVIGRTNTPAFSIRWDTDNALYGPTANPFSRAHTPGGSSGGAAAAVATGMGALGHGNDLGGSVRYPAYACGVVGIRPSFGRVPAWNATAPAERPPSTQLMSVQGPLARTVADARLGLMALAVGDPRDPWWVPAPLTGPPVRRPIRVALLDAHDAWGAARIHADVRAAVAQAARWLADAGYAVEPANTPSCVRAVEVWQGLQCNEIRRLMWPLIESHGDDAVRTSVRFFLERTPECTLDGYMKLLAERTQLVREWTLFLEHYPLVLSPVSFEPPFTRGFDTGDQARMDEVLDAQRPQLLVPLLGIPAVAVPTGLAGGLPMGVQILGRRFREDLCLDAAGVIEARAPVLTPLDPR